MRAGMALSAMGHAALVALAVWALPWLRVRPEPPVPAIAVSLVGEADLAALARRAAAAKAPPPPPAAAEPEVQPSAPGPRFLPPREPEVPEPPPPAPEDFDLEPGFDAASPLGLPAPAGTPPPAPATEPPPEAEAEPEAPAAHASVLRERHLTALATAVRRGRVYPPAARGRGLSGVARLYLVIGRDGSLIELQLVASSGSVTLDQAAVAAARRAHLPAAPDDLPGESFSFLQDLEFDPQ